MREKLGNQAKREEARREKGSSETHLGCLEDTASGKLALDEGRITRCELEARGRKYAAGKLISGGMAARHGELDYGRSFWRFD
jgi:hypothetical protein